MLYYSTRERPDPYHVSFVSCKSQPPLSSTLSSLTPISSDEDEEDSASASQTSCASSNIILTYRSAPPQKEASPTAMVLPPLVGNHIAPQPISQQPATNTATTTTTTTRTMSSPHKIASSSMLDFTNYAVDYSLARPNEPPCHDPLDDLLMDLQQSPPTGFELAQSSVLAPTSSQNDKVMGDFLDEMMNDPLFHI